MSKFEIPQAKEDVYKAIQRMMESLADADQFLVMAWVVKDGEIEGRPHKVLSIDGHVMLNFPNGDIPLAADLMKRYLQAPAATPQHLPAASLEEVLQDD